ncbi:MAG: polymerase, sigma-24 subunit, subfamily [Solirubrobacterales bacterium]|nr:polymerase, sigma-24 subunit, subfamily [Solirubrobacterales bacterium]
MTDAEIIVASRTEPARFRALYDRHADDLLAYFYRRTFDAEVAADLLAETFAVAFEKRGRFRDRGRPGGAWLYGIAAKELSHWYRRRSVELRAARRLGVAVPALDDESIARIEALADSAAERTRMSEALTRLPVGERDAVRLRVIDELDYGSIAARLRCSEGAARTRVHRGLARLRQQMEAQA